MASFHSLLWLANTPLFICTTSFPLSESIYLFFIYFWLHPQHMQVLGPGTKPTPQQWPQPQQWQCQMLTGWATWELFFWYRNFFIHSSVDGHLGCFHVLAVVNSATVNTGVHVSFQIMVLSGHMLRSGIAGLYMGKWLNETSHGKWAAKCLTHSRPS